MFPVIRSAVASRAAARVCIHYVYPKYFALSIQLE
jgi:hypothetical protein